MTRKQLTEGDLVYHAVHGLCRMDRLVQEKHAEKSEVFYAFIPKSNCKMKSRFLISAGGLEASGFHPLISLSEANRILDYFKTGNSEMLPSNSAHQIWKSAKDFLALAYEKFEAKDQRKRQTLLRLAKGLVGELAFVFNTPLKDMAEKILISLKKVSKLNPSVMPVLSHMSEDHF